jgi:hypothetical protein
MYACTYVCMFRPSQRRPTHVFCIADYTDAVALLALENARLSQERIVLREVHRDACAREQARQVFEAGVALDREHKRAQAAYRASLDHTAELEQLAREEQHDLRERRAREEYLRDRQAARAHMAQFDAVFERARSEHMDDLEQRRCVRILIMFVVCVCVWVR